MNKSPKNILLTVTLAFIYLLSCVQFAQAENRAKEEKLISRGEMAVMLSATDFMKKKIGDIFNMAIGYNLLQLNRATTAPIIKMIKINPYKVPSDGKAIFLIEVSVDDPGGLSDIREVRADASAIGKLPNMLLVDNGLYGDRIANDGIYTLQTSIVPGVDPGDKEIVIAVTNHKGWLSLAKTDVMADSPELRFSSRAVPSKIAAQGRITTYFSVEPADNIDKVWADLTQLGGGQQVPLLSMDNGSYSLEFNVSPQEVPGTKKIRFFVQKGSYTTAAGEAELAVTK